VRIGKQLLDGHANIPKQERKRFFFEKKNQKTFIHKNYFGVALRIKLIKVFCFFFSKKKTFP